MAAGREGRRGEAIATTLRLRAQDAEAPQWQDESNDARLAARLANSELTLELLRADVARLRAALATMSELAQAAGVQPAGFLAELEVWRHQESKEAVQLHPRPHMASVVQEALRQLVPRSHYEPCVAMQFVRVRAVKQVANVSLWKQYALRRQQTADALRDRRTCPWANRVAPGVADLGRLFPHVRLEPMANEVLLLHGTKAELAKRISRQGFDDRVLKRGLYGHGVYFSTEACKAAQFCGGGGHGCIILARVILGHPFLAAEPTPKNTRPPEVWGQGVPHDSTIARPGIPNGTGGFGLGGGAGLQTHWEFVVQRGDLQAYPELIIEIEWPQW